MQLSSPNGCCSTLLLLMGLLLAAAVRSLRLVGQQLLYPLVHTWGQGSRQGDERCLTEPTEYPVGLWRLPTATGLKSTPKCWRGGSGQLLNLGWRRNNTAFVLVVEHWTSSLLSSQCWRVLGSLPNQSIYIFVDLKAYNCEGL